MLLLIISDKGIVAPGNNQLSGATKQFFIILLSSPVYIPALS